MWVLLNSNIDTIYGVTPLNSSVYKINDCLNIDTSSSTYTNIDRIGYVANEDPNTSVYNSPVSGVFYAYRKIYKLPKVQLDGSIRYGVTVIVQLIEAYPIAGRIWINVYNQDGNVWSGWKSTTLS